MPKVISIHEYQLKIGVDEDEFERAIDKAKERGLFKLPGLEAFHFVRGLRGVRQGEYAAIWIYKDLEAWEKLWGKPGEPRNPEDYAENWKIWEKEVLVQYLDRDADKINFTAYKEI